MLSPRASVDRLAIRLARDAQSILAKIDNLSDKYNAIAKALNGIGYEQVPIIHGGPNLHCTEDYFHEYGGWHETIPECVSRGPGKQQQDPIEQEPSQPRPKGLSKKAREHRNRLLTLGAACSWICVYCSRQGTPEYDIDGRSWHIDHFYPRSLGGDNRIDNLVLACATCNLKKGSKLVGDVLEAARAAVNVQ